jgi:hypothetical protein
MSVGDFEAFVDTVAESLKRNFQAALTDNEGAPQEDLGRPKPKNKKRNSRSRSRKN